MFQDFHVHDQKIRVPSGIEEMLIESHDLRGQDHLNRTEKLYPKDTSSTFYNSVLNIY